MRSRCPVGARPRPHPSDACDSAFAAARLSGNVQAPAGNLLNRALTALAARAIEPALTTGEENIDLTRGFDRASPMQQGYRSPFRSSRSATPERAVDVLSPTSGMMTSRRGAEHDGVLYDDTVVLHARLVAAGGESRLDVWPGTLHVGHGAPVLKEVHDAMGQVADIIAKHVSLRYSPSVQEIDVSASCPTVKGVTVTPVTG